MPPKSSSITQGRYPAADYAPEILDRLVAGQFGADGVLSVFLDIDPSQAQREGYEAALLDLWKPLREAMKGTDLEDRVEEEIERVTGYVRDWKQPPGRSVAIFSCAPRNLFIPVAFEIPLDAGARFAERPYVLPILMAADEHERYTVLLLDKERALIMQVRMGRIEDRIEIVDTVPGRTAAGGWSQAGFARHREYHVDRHLHRVIDELWRLHRQHLLGRLLLGGPPEVLAALRAILPRLLSRAIEAEFSGESFAGDADVLHRVAGIAEQTEREHETELVDRFLDASPNLRVLGWDDTLSALVEGRVHVLFIARGQTASGYACPEGHITVVDQLETCPFCREPVWPVSDLCSWAVGRALATGASVEFLGVPAAERLRPAVVAGSLRY
jgi:peptide subunit release factor 1 (eRF1)